MSFHSTAQEIRVDDGHILRAKVPNGAGELVDAELDLDSVLGNSDGKYFPSLPLSCLIQISLLCSAQEANNTSTGNFQWGSGGTFKLTSDPRYLEIIA